MIHIRPGLYRQSHYPPGQLQHHILSDHRLIACQLLLHCRALSDMMIVSCQQLNACRPYMQNTDLSYIVPYYRIYRIYTSCLLLGENTAGKQTVAYTNLKDNILLRHMSSA